jgi:hypothetical protein
MNYDRIAELERQTAVAFAAIGTSLAETLAEADIPPRVLDTLRMKSRVLHSSLDRDGTAPAATMFGAFAEALCETAGGAKR